jgi:hypothetical protein
VKDTFRGSLNAFYMALKDKKGSVNTFLNDTVFAFGIYSNITPAFIQKSVDTIRLKKQISNSISPKSQVNVTSDSSGMYIKYSENGNYLIDRKQEVKDMENLVTVLFSYDFKLKSYEYETIKGTAILDSAQSPVIEIFYYGSLKSNIGLWVGKVEKALKASGKYRVFTSNKFPLAFYDTSSKKNEIMYNGNDEFIIARSVQSFLYKSTGLKLQTTHARTPTPNYLSIFIRRDDLKSIFSK